VIERSRALEKRLRERRSRLALARLADTLEEIGLDPSQYRPVALDEVDSIWPRFVTRLRNRAESAERWPARDRDVVVKRLAEVARDVTGLPVVWLFQADSEPVGVEVPADPVIRSALTHFVSRAADLMLATRDVTDGLTLELNHYQEGDEYELVTWGRFRRDV
jgi:hypothetical protein